MRRPLALDGRRTAATAMGWPRVTIRLMSVESVPSQHSVASPDGGVDALARETRRFGFVSAASVPVPSGDAAAAADGSPAATAARRVAVRRGFAPASPRKRPLLPREPWTLPHCASAGSSAGAFRPRWPALPPPTWTRQSAMPSSAPWFACESRRAGGTLGTGSGLGLGRGRLRRGLGSRCCRAAWRPHGAAADRPLTHGCGRRRRRRRCGRRQLIHRWSGGLASRPLGAEQLLDLRRHFAPRLGRDWRAFRLAGRLHVGRSWPGLLLLWLGTRSPVAAHRPAVAIGHA